MDKAIPECIAIIFSQDTDEDWVKYTVVYTLSEEIVTRAVKMMVINFTILTALKIFSNKLCVCLLLTIIAFI